MRNGTVMVPLGAIAKNLGYKNSWDSETRVLEFNVDGKYLTFTVNSTAFSNGFDSNQKCVDKLESITDFMFIYVN